MPNILVSPQGLLELTQCLSSLTLIWYFLRDDCGKNDSEEKSTRPQELICAAFCLCTISRSPLELVIWLDPVIQ